MGAVKAQQQKLDRVPKLVAADAGFYSRENEQAVQQMGVAYVSIPNRNTRSQERRKLQKKRWFKAGQKWRTGCEGRISVLKRGHGLSRCRYCGLAGMRRWVGLGVIADNLLNIGHYLAPKLAWSASGLRRRPVTRKHHSSPSKFTLKRNCSLTIAYFAPESRLIIDPDRLLFHRDRTVAESLELQCLELCRSDEQIPPNH